MQAAPPTRLLRRAPPSLGLAGSVGDLGDAVFDGLALGTPLASPTVGREVAQPMGAGAGRAVLLAGATGGRPAPLVRAGDSLAELLGAGPGAPGSSFDADVQRNFMNAFGPKIVPAVLSPGSLGNPGGFDFVGGGSGGTTAAGAGMPPAPPPRALRRNTSGGGGSSTGAPSTRQTSGGSASGGARGAAPALLTSAHGGSSGLRISKPVESPPDFRGLEALQHAACAEELLPEGGGGLGMPPPPPPVGMYSLARGTSVDSLGGPTRALTRELSELIVRWGGGGGQKNGLGVFLCVSVSPPPTQVLLSLPP